MVLSFWRQEYTGFTKSLRAEPSPLSKTDRRVLIEPRLRNMLAQPSSTSPLRRLDG